MSIQQLPDYVIAQIKSSTTITSLNAVVCGLVKNALDAQATKLTISLDYSRGSCSVEDNGVGIPPPEFRDTGGLGKLHYTSKYPVQANAHGRNGTFLASVGSLSLLSITSHHCDYQSHNSIRIHNSDVLARHIPCLPEHRLLSFPHGTRVTVRDLFGTLPVRVKQRAVDVEKGVSTREWERLRQALVALIIAWPGEVSVSLRESVNQWNLSVRIAEVPKSKTTRGEAVPYHTSRLPKVLHQARLADDGSSNSWIPLRASTGRVSVIGAVSLLPIATRRIQFVSIGIQPVLNEHGSNILYEEINRLFANSDFGIEDEKVVIDDDEQRRREKDRRYKSDGFTHQELKGRKGVDRWPTFYIQVNLGDMGSHFTVHDAEEILDDRHDILNTIVDLLRVVFHEFLKKHHFRPTHFRGKKRHALNQPRIDGSGSTASQKSQTTEAGSQMRRSVSLHNISSIRDLANTRLNIESAKGRRPRSESPFDLWSRIKSGRPLNADGNRKTGPDHDRCTDNPRGFPGLDIPSSQSQISRNPTPLVGADGQLLRAPFTDAESSCSAIPVGGASQGQRLSELQSKSRDNDEMSWINPATSEVLKLDSRTGFVIRPRNESSQNVDSHLPSKKRLRLQTRAPLNDTNSPWLDNVLSNWENPVFQSVEAPIPTAFNENNAVGLTTKSWDGNCGGCGTEYGNNQSALPAVQGQISRHSLRTAEVISQVDRKFVFVKTLIHPPHSQRDIPQGGSPLLLIVDQHAADERCRVENLMKEYFEIAESSEGGAEGAVSARTESLEKPIQFDVSVRDSAHFERSVAYFKHWGVVYQVKHSSASTHAASSYVQVLRLPPSILERCRLEPRILIDLMRKEVWELDEKGIGPLGRPISANINASHEDAPKLHWLTRFHGCPQGILDIINSRACRSSIMFNDHLSYDECVELIRSLADCALPFQCAHGRPSLIPLVDLGRDFMESPEQKNQGNGFIGNFRKWKCNMKHDGTD
ncbi:hypothetical protein F4778DRAFT_748542 [Xylariomycetidae sp. FL2044]|nr:hypothetical protein F4778DRAFT_748542 [Xylariomycetidae sp. FL2044]